MSEKPRLPELKSVDSYEEELASLTSFTDKFSPELQRALLAYRDGKINGDQIAILFLELFNWDSLKIWDEDERRYLYSDDYMDDLEQELILFADVALKDNTSYAPGLEADHRDRIDTYVTWIISNIFMQMAVGIQRAEVKDKVTEALRKDLEELVQEKEFDMTENLIKSAGLESKIFYSAEEINALLLQIQDEFKGGFTPRFPEEEPPQFFKFYAHLAGDPGTPISERELIFEIEIHDNGQRLPNQILRIYFEKDSLKLDWSKPVWIKDKD